MSNMDVEAQKRHLKKLITNLTRTERLIIVLYYHDEMTIKEIGAKLGLSESRVSQIHSCVNRRVSMNATRAVARGDAAAKNVLSHEAADIVTGTGYIDIYYPQILDLTCRWSLLSQLPEQAHVAPAYYREMRDRVTVAVKDASERILEPISCVVGIRGDDRLVEDLAPGKIGVQINVSGQDEVLVVIFGTLAKQHQVLCRSDLIWVIRLSRPAVIFAISKHADNTDSNQERNSPQDF